MIIEIFNLTHILTILLIPIIAYFALVLILNRRGENVKRNALLCICCFNAIMYIVYKFAQAQNAPYDFDIFTNLPLHFCNINLILLPLAILLKNKCLMAYQFYFGTILACLALVTVHPNFVSTPVYHFTTFFYFYYHSMLVVIPVLLVKFKFFTPSFKMVWQPTLMLVALTLVIHIINVIFRTTGIAYYANYFFTFGLYGDFFTELFWRIIPFEFFFLLPALVTLAPYVIITTLPFHLSEKRKRKMK